MVVTSYHPNTPALNELKIRRPISIPLKKLGSLTIIPHPFFNNSSIGSAFLICQNKDLLNLGQSVFLSFSKHNSLLQILNDPRSCVPFNSETKKAFLKEVGISQVLLKRKRKTPLEKLKVLVLNLRLKRLSETGVFIDFPKNIKEFQKVKRLNKAPIFCGLAIEKNLRDKTDYSLSNPNHSDLAHMLKGPIRLLKTFNLFKFDKEQNRVLKPVHVDLGGERQTRPVIELNSSIETFNTYFKAQGYRVEEIKKITKALTLAYNVHKEQFRSDGSEYITHLIAAAIISENVRQILNLEKDPNLIIAALLHDSVEDQPERVIQLLTQSKQVKNKTSRKRLSTNMAYTKVDKLGQQKIALSLIKKNFGEEVFKIVSSVTKPIDKSKRSSHLKGIIDTGIKAVIVKFSDRLHNLQTLEWMNIDKIVPKLLETYHEIIPLLEPDPDKNPEVSADKLKQLQELLTRCIFKKSLEWAIHYYQYKIIPELKSSYLGIEIFDYLVNHTLGIVKLGMEVKNKYNSYQERRMAQVF